MENDLPLESCRKKQLLSYTFIYWGIVAAQLACFALLCQMSVRNIKLILPLITSIAITDYLHEIMRHPFRIHDRFSIPAIAGLWIGLYLIGLKYIACAQRNYYIYLLIIHFAFLVLLISVDYNCSYYCWWRHFAKP